MLNLSGSNVQASLFTKNNILIKNVSTRYMYLHGRDIYTITTKTHPIHLLNMTILPLLSFVL